MLPSRPVSWDVFLATSPHPLAPCLKDILEKDFSIEERTLFESAVRPRLEIRDTFSTDRMAYLTATKPMPNEYLVLVSRHPGSRGFRERVTRDQRGLRFA
jgi:hypothetical protein